MNSSLLRGAAGALLLGSAAAGAAAAQPAACDRACLEGFVDRYLVCRVHNHTTQVPLSPNVTPGRSGGVSAVPFTDSTPPVACEIMSKLL